MGIELSTIDPATVGGFDGRCDGCDRFEPLSATTPAVATVMLRGLGWGRVDYITTASHYVWHCPKCKAKK